MLRLLAVASALVLAVTVAQAQQTTASLPYGPAITFEMAKKVMAAAESEAEKNNWTVVITIIDSGGNMVMMHRLDNAQLSALSASEGKARTALTFKRPSKDLEDAVAAGGAGLRLAALPGVTPLEGGLPLVHDGKIIGAIGVSGVLSAYNTQIARAGVDAAAK
jgi:glc operon protein GlcG